MYVYISIDVYRCIYICVHISMYLSIDNYLLINIYIDANT